MRKLKVCFVFPRFRYISGDPPLGVAYLASFLDKNMDIALSIIDTTFNRSLKYVYDSICNIKPDIIGIYADSLMAKNAITIAKWSQESRFYTILGGPHVTVRPETFIPYADVIVRGEGESVLSLIISSYDRNGLSHIPGIWWKKKNQVIKNASNQNLVNLNDVPFPKRDLLNMQKYMYYWNYLDAINIGIRGTTILASRGCPFSCTFCQPAMRDMFGKKVRFRSPRNVVEEIKALKEAYSIEGIFFHDDTFTLDHSWLTQFCELLEKEKSNILWGCNSRVDTVDEAVLRMMYEVGLRSIHFGIESGSQRILDEVYNKKIKIEQAKDTVEKARKIGIYPMSFFMIGAPTETEEEINETISLAKNLKLEEATFSLTTPLAGTYLYDMILSSDIYSIKPDNDDVDYYSAYTLRGGINPRRIKFLKFKALLLFYIHPFRFHYIIRHIFSLRGLKKLLNKVRRYVRCI